MREVEKRLGLDAAKAATLKAKINAAFVRATCIRRTILIKTGEGFVPDPKSLVDIKIKLIDNESILSVKYGSWHGDTARQEYETHFERNDLSALIASLSVLSYDHFILLSTLRSVWRTEGATVTLDEYANADRRALFEVEAGDGSAGEECVDRVFERLNVTPMGSPATIAFINEINTSKDVRVKLHERAPEEAAALMLRNHGC